MNYGMLLLGQPLLGAAYPGAHGAMGPVLAGGFLALLFVAVIWSLAWKGVALWYAARNRQTAWFVVMLIVNTLGILEILYILFFRADRPRVGSSAAVAAPAADSSAPVQ